MSEVNNDDFHKDSEPEKKEKGGFTCKGILLLVASLTCGSLIGPLANIVPA